MLEPDRDRALTRKERLAVVLAVLASAAVHLLLFAGTGGFEAWTNRERKRERLMVIRQVREVAPAQDLAPAAPTRQVQARFEPEPAAPAPKGAPGFAPTPPKPARQQLERIPGEPPREPELSEKMEQEAREAEASPEQEPAAEPSKVKAPPGEGDSSVSVVTDLPAASFEVKGPQEYQGTGTFWLRKGAPPGTYTVTFKPVAGFVTPAAQSKELAAKGQIVFVGKYKRSTEVVVETDPEAQLTIYRPDGKPLDLRGPGRALFDDLPPGNYTAVFKPIPGHETPGPATSTLTPGGRLVFKGEYRHLPGGTGGGGAAGGTGIGGGTGVAGGTGSGTYRGGSPPPPPARKRRPADEPPPEAAGRGAQLDRRVQMIVKSYPKTDIEDYHDPIPYPERIIQRGNFQSGWCQVYLVVHVDERGEVADVFVERPRPDERARFADLIAAVEGAVRRWDYDKVAAEVNVDVRFYVE